MKTKILTRGLLCVVCGYDLRGLAVESKCPECGHWIEGSWTAAKGGWHSAEGIASLIILDWITAAAEAAGLSVDGCRFVLDAIPAFPESRRSRPRINGKVQRHLTAADVCIAVREYAAAYFDGDADEAKECLEAWKVRTSEDVGAIIYTMAESQLILQSPQDRREQFNGLFTFDDLISGIAPHPQLT